MEDKIAVSVPLKSSTTPPLTFSQRLCLARKQHKDGEKLQQKLTLGKLPISPQMFLNIDLINPFQDVSIPKGQSLREYILQQSFIKDPSCLISFASLIRKLSTKQSKSSWLPETWYTVGVLYKKGAVVRSNKGAQFQILEMTDLKGTQWHAVLSKKCLAALEKEPPGGIFIFLQPEVVNPTEKGGRWGCYIDSLARFVRIGTSVDLGSCQGKMKGGNSCGRPLDRRESKWCPAHSFSTYTAQQGKRPELFSFNSAYTSSNEGKLDSNERNVTFVLGNQHVVKSGFIRKNSTSNTKQSNKKQSFELLKKSLNSDRSMGALYFQQHMKKMSPNNEHL